MRGQVSARNEDRKWKMQCGICAISCGPMPHASMYGKRTSEVPHARDSVCHDNGGGIWAAIARISQTAFVTVERLFVQRIHHLP